MAKVKGIRKRWMLNSISAVLLIVLFAVAAFSAAITSYFYSTMSIGLNSRITSALPYFSSVKSRSEYYQSASNYVQNFTEKNRLELQIINPSGSIYESTNDLTISGSYPNTPDVTGAIEERKQSSWSGTAPVTGERIMSVSAPIVSRNGTLIGVIRMVTSLSRADIQVVKIVAAALAVGATIVLLVYFSNLYFVRSIVEPVTAVTDTAKRIAAGSYGIQMEKKYDDEVGDLIDAVNDMSMKIKQSEKMKSEFISSVSHELRTPLTAINGWAETIMNGEVRDASDVKKGMGIIVSEARRLTNMVEELLEFSRIEDGRFTLSVEPMDIKAELEDAVYTYTEFFRREGITLTHTDCEEEFPPIPGDPERMRQVFCNLLDNAAKHGGSGKRIDTAIRREGDAAVITIRDYGPGIPEEELPHVKYKFYKGSSKARGSGIGLAVCEEIVTRHNGRLDIGNAEGGGCIVTIRLPIGG
ncbi:sensor histidine kinase [Intestinimonas butyriciproducens]|uniref:histidine kinase n=1 Tax=Intestinimonas butyriciproducens TaxID=1297617 RepID=A0A0S2W5P8_9FIRM|nr:ATP-binding protein [Intestinimonas butyriciproducens]ALP94662.1 Phosphate regulon sensor protein PhoR (SphS) [Intestinimonas butyriciproducens]